MNARRLSVVATLLPVVQSLGRWVEGEAAKYA